MKSKTKKSHNTLKAQKKELVSCSFTRWRFNFHLLVVSHGNRFVRPCTGKEEVREFGKNNRKLRTMRNVTKLSKNKKTCFARKRKTRQISPFGDFFPVKGVLNPNFRPFSFEMNKK